MDTIHHLLRVNVEIEGALRVLANRDNEIAMRILEDKAHELYQIVQYLAHPEEDIVTSDEEEARDTPTETSEKSESDVIDINDHPSVFSNIDASVVSVVESMASPLSDDSVNHDSISFDDSMAESEAICRVLVSDDNISEEVNTMITGQNSESSIHSSTSDNLTLETGASDISKNSGRDENETLSILPSEISHKKKTFINQGLEPQKDKLRIDEMLSRREALNLSKAFTINDRFRFQLHLFDGDKEVFNKTIDAISAMKDYESATTYLSGILDIQSDDQDITDFMTIIQNHFGIIG